MSEQASGGGVIPENQTADGKTDSSKTNQNPPRAGQEDYEEGRSEQGVAGQGAGQLTDADRERLETGK